MDGTTADRTDCTKYPMGEAAERFHPNVVLSLGRRTWKWAPAKA
jgi:hypothetical protein